MAIQRIVEFLYHSAGLYLLTYTIRCHYEFVFPISRDADFSGSFKYLTFLNVIAQLIYFSLAVFSDMFRFATRSDLVSRIKDKYFAIVAHPYCLLVASTFWIIYGIDKEMIWPKALEDVIPWFVNHLLHTTILITELEFLFCNHNYPQRSTGLKLSVLVGLSYFVWISYVKYHIGHWPYPFMDILSVPFFVLFFVVILTLVISFYVIGEKLNSEPSDNRKLKKKQR